ncbi:GMC oxidoreductase [Streptomyces viridosporus]|uniref:GMC oxidoreductase n=1 Tax=Streptomyces viridosporus TaxID=67581 RepID=UPI00332BC547
MSGSTGPPPPGTPFRGAAALGAPRSTVTGGHRTGRPCGAPQRAAPAGFRRSPPRGRAARGRPGPVRGRFGHHRAGAGPPGAGPQWGGHPGPAPLRARLSGSRARYRCRQGPPRPRHGRGARTLRGRPGVRAPWRGAWFAIPQLPRTSAGGLAKHRLRLPRRPRGPPPSPGRRPCHRGPLESPPCAGPARGLLGPGPELLDEDRPLDRWSHEHLGTAQHTCGTVPRGPVDGPEHAAVDQFGRVHGVRGPRVADTSIPPDTPHRGPAATAVLTGELIAGAIRLDLPGAGRDPGSRGRPDPASPPAANTASSVATGPPLPGRNRPAAGQPSGRSRSHEGASPIRCRMTSEPRKVS